MLPKCVQLGVVAIPSCRTLILTSDRNKCYAGKNPAFIQETQRLNAERLVHSEVKSNELGFSCLSPEILFHKRIKWFKTFYDKTKPLIEHKDSKIYCCNKFIVCRLNMYLKVLLYSLRSNSLC